MAVDIEIRHLRAFAAVAGELSFTRAASRLHVTQQALSATVRQLERRLGVQLFIRSTRTVSMTTAGELFLAQLVPVLGRLDGAITAVRQFSDDLRLTATIGYSSALENERLNRLFDRMRQAHPEVRLLVFECWTEEAIEGVAEGRLDAAVVVAPGARSGLTSHRLGVQEVGVVLERDADIASLDRVPIHALNGWTLEGLPARLSPTSVSLSAMLFPGHSYKESMLGLSPSGRRLFSDDGPLAGGFTEARSFTVALEPAVVPLPEGLVWRPLDPQVNVYWECLYRSDDQPAWIPSLLGLDSPP
jgi:DNA-binding transcriptional LysR family regulator